MFTPNLPTKTTAAWTSRLGQLALTPAGAFLLLFAVAFLCYGQSLDGEFLWDDGFLVEHNPLIRSPALVGEMFRHYLFLDSASTFYRPVQNLSYLVDYWRWGMNPFGYRLTNLLLHAANGWLLCLLLRRLLPALLGAGVPAATAPAAALGVALVWVAHPVHSAAVAYVAGRADSLAVGFALGAWLLYERGRSATGPRRAALCYGTALGSLLLALCSKEMAAIWAALFALHLFCFRGSRSLRHAGLTAGAIAGCFAAYLVLRHLPVLPPGVTAPPHPALAQRWLLMLRALADYAGLMLCPVRLCMERQVFLAYGNQYNAWLRPYYLSLGFAGPVVLAALGYLAWRPGPARALRAFGAAWFLVAFLPVSNLFVLNASVAEHWLYVPSIGFLLLLVGSGLLLPERARLRVGIATFAVGVPLLVARTVARSEDWRNETVFVTQTIAHGGDSPRVQTMLANLARNHGDPARGEAVLRVLIQRNPGNDIARLNLANNLFRQKRLLEAAELFLELIKNPPERATDPRPLPYALRRLRDLDVLGLTTPDAAWTAALDGGLRCAPESWDLLDLKVQSLRGEGRTDEALERLENYTRVRSWDLRGFLLLGRLHAERGETNHALTALRRVGELDIRETESLVRRADLLLGMDHTTEAYEMINNAIHRLPIASLQREVLAGILAHQTSDSTAVALRPALRVLAESSTESR